MRYRLIDSTHNNKKEHKVLKIRKLVLFFIYIILICSFFPPGLSLAKETGPAESDGILNISLKEAVSTAINKNPQLKASKYSLKSSEAGVKKARSSFFPNVSINETVNRTTNPMWAFGTKLNQELIASEDFSPASLNNPEPINNFSTSISVSWPIFAGGKIVNGYKIASFGKQAGIIDLKGTTQAVIAQTEKAYMGLLLAIKNLSVIQQSLESANASLKLVQARFDGGFSVKSDLLRAKVRIADLEQQKLSGESQIHIAEAYLASAMGISVETRLNPVTSFGECIDYKEPLNKWIDKALLNRSEIKMMTLHKKMAQKKVAISKAEYLPGVQLIGKYELNSEDFQDNGESYTIGAVMQMNLFNGFGSKASIKSDEYSVLKIGQMIKSLKNNIRVQTKEAYLNVQSSNKRVKVAKTAVVQAEEALRIIKNRYGTGLLTIVNLLDSEVALQQAKMILFKAMHDNKVAGIQLELAAGIINIDGTIECGGSYE